MVVPDSSQCKLKIISGGQTGVDRAALDSALNRDVDCGGWCPEGREAEDGLISEKYRLTEVRGGRYVDRTLKNVLDSDGTVIIYFTACEGGTERTREFCIENNKPMQLIDATATNTLDAARVIFEFITRNHVNVLNVAGPRHSKQPQAYNYTFDALTRFIDKFCDTTKSLN